MRRALDHDHSVTVAVRPGAALTTRSRLFQALEAAFPVSFRAARSAEDRADAMIEFCDGPGLPAAGELARGGVPVFALAGDGDPRAPDEAVGLLDVDAVDRRMRGVEFLEPLDGPDLGHIGESEQILARSASGPAWTVTPGERPVHRLRSSLPELAPDQVLSDLLLGRAFPLVAVVHFLRALTAADSFRPPPLRAAFLFDDPNLRWRTYGFIDYARLLEHADLHGYHASMAMIPLDVGRPHRATAALFRDRPDRLSLAVHGNNHSTEELLRLTDDGQALKLAAQALLRVARFESRYGLRVDRVMAPPHGLCSESTTRALARVGFDALCATHPLPWTHRPPPSRLLAGWEPAEFVGGGAVLPRIPFTASRQELGVRAFLGQPLVLYGHHADLADGLDLLAETAARVNGLGEVRWTSLANIVATNYATRSEGDAVRVLPYSRRVRPALNGDLRRLVVEAPRDGEPELLGWSTNGGPPAPFQVPVRLPLHGTDIHLRGVDEIDPRAVPAPTWRPWPRIRRVATELRDRVQAFQALGVGVLAADPAAGTVVQWL